MKSKKPKVSKKPRYFTKRDGVHPAIVPLYKQEWRPPKKWETG